MKVDLIILPKTTWEKPYTLLPQRRFHVQFNEPLLILAPEITKELGRFLRPGIHPIILDGDLFKNLRREVGIRIQTDDVSKVCALLELDSEDPSIQKINAPD